MKKKYQKTLRTTDTDWNNIKQVCDIRSLLEMKLEKWDLGGEQEEIQYTI